MPISHALGLFICFVRKMFPLAGEESGYLALIAIQNWCKKRKRELEREMHFYFAFPFEFHKLCKTRELRAIVETLLDVFRMRSAV